MFEKINARRERRAYNKFLRLNAKRIDRTKTCQFQWQAAVYTVIDTLRKRSGFISK